MDAQNRAQGTTQEDKPSADQPTSGSGKRDKFPEPTAWALNWETMHRDQLANQAGGRFDSDQELRGGNGKAEKFPQPRGWALNWDGASIAALQDDVKDAPSANNEPDLDGA